MGYWHSPQTDSVLSESLPEARKHVILSHKLIRAGRTMNKEIAIFKTDAESINVEVLFEDETV